MCGVLFGVQCSRITPNLVWTIPIPNKTKTNPVVNRAQGYKILHLADIHLDFLYLVGSDPYCGETLCCRDITNNTKGRAGKWGSYPCDLPLNTLSFLTENELKGEDFDLLYYTGDSVPHDNWEYTRNNTIRITRTITDLLKRFTNKRVIMAFGNHEIIPLNWFVIYFSILINFIYIFIFKKKIFNSVQN
jgi:hypothetical protein